MSFRNFFSPKPPLRRFTILPEHVRKVRELADADDAAKESRTTHYELWSFVAELIPETRWGSWQLRFDSVYSVEVVELPAKRSTPRWAKDLFVAVGVGLLCACVGVCGYQIGRIGQNPEAYGRGYLEGANAAAKRAEEMFDKVLHDGNYRIVKQADYLIIPKADVPKNGILVVSQRGRVQSKVTIHQNYLSGDIGSGLPILGARP